MKFLKVCEISMKSILKYSNVSQNMYNIFKYVELSWYTLKFFKYLEITWSAFKCSAVLYKKYFIECEIP